MEIPRAARRLATRKLKAALPAIIDSLTSKATSGSADAVRLLMRIAEEPSEVSHPSTDFEPRRPTIAGELLREMGELLPEEEDAYDAQAADWLDWADRHPAEAHESNRRHTPKGDEPRAPRTSFPPRKQGATNAGNAAKTA